MTASTAMVPASDVEAPIVPQLIEGFAGIAAEAFPEAARKVLLEPVDPDRVEIRPDGIVYLPGVWYRQQLCRAFGPGGWALAPRDTVKFLDREVVWHGALFCLGRFAADAVGECAKNPKMSHASAAEGAKTDCLSRCGKDLGMASELWDPQWRAWWLALYAYVDGVDDRGKDKWWRRTNEHVAFFLGRKPVYSPATAQADIDAAKSGKSPNPAFKPDATPPRATQPAAASRNSSTPVEKTAAKPAPKDEPISRAQTNELGTRVKKIGMSKDRSREWVQKVFAAEGWAKLSRKAADQAKVRLDAIIVVQEKLAELKIDDDTAALWMEQHFAGDGEKLDWMTLDAERLAHAVTLLDEEAKS